MKKLINLFLSVTIISSSLLVTGCGSSSNTSSNDSTSNVESNAESEKSKLVIWGAVPEESGPKDLIDAWNEKNPNNPAEYVRFTNDDTGNTKLDTAILSGEQIDVIFTYQSGILAQRANGGMVLPLSEFGVEEFITGNIIGGTEGVPKFYDEYYALPTAKDVNFFMVNQDMLEENNVVIDNEWDVAEFMDTAKTLTTEKDGKKVYGTHGYYADFPLSFAKAVIGPDFYYKEGGKESNFDSEEFRYTTKTKELMDLGYSMSFEEIFSRQLSSYCHSAFLNEEVAMMPAASWMIRYVLDKENYPHDFKTAFVAFPTTEKGVANDYQATLGNYISICNNTKNKEAAWEFVKFWITDGSEYMLTGGKIPVWTQVNEDLAAQKILGSEAEKMFNVQSYKDVVFNKDIKYIVDTVTTGLPEITQIYKEESELYFLDSISEEEYFKNLKERSDEVINAALK